MCKKQKKKRRVKCIANVKALIWPDSSPTHYQSRSMQVPPGSHRDFDLDCSPIVVADRQGWFNLGGEPILIPQ